MCGIAAVHDLSPRPTPERLAEGASLGEDMLSRLHHRGPDGHGSRQVGPTWLGHTRLSIVDLDGGRQPLPDGTGRRWVVANGEIYNHQDLRERLPGPFATDLALLAPSVGLRVAPGPRFGPDGTMESYLRLPFTTGVDRLITAVGRLAAEYTLVENVFTTPLEDELLKSKHKQRMARLDGQPSDWSPINTAAWSPSGSTLTKEQ